MSYDIPRIITKKELRLLVPYSPQHILRLEKMGKFPRRIKIGARRVGWYLHLVLEWLNEKASSHDEIQMPLFENLIVDEDQSATTCTGEQLSE